MRPVELLPILKTRRDLDRVLVCKLFNRLYQRSVQAKVYFRLGIHSYMHTIKAHVTARSLYNKQQGLLIGDN